MLQHSSLLVHGWTQTVVPKEEDAWIRPITDLAHRRLGFVRYQKLAPISWLFWLRKTRLDVFETEDASLLMSLTRSWTMLPIWELHDAEDRHVGSVYPRSLVADGGQALGYLDLETEGQGRILDHAGRMLLTFAKKNGDICELAFAAQLDANPFLRMLMLGYILSLDSSPKRLG